LATALQTFVTDYNAYQKQLATSTAYTSSTNSGAVLTDDPTTMQVNSELSDLVSGSFYGAGTIQSLTQLGVTVNNDGTLTFDQSTLDAAFAANPTAVQNFFTTKTQGFSDQVNTMLTQLAGKTNSVLSNQVSALQQIVTQNQAQITEMNAHLSNEENQLYTEYDAMDAAIAKLQNSMAVVQSISYIGEYGNTATSSASTSSASPSLMTSSANFGTACSTGSS
jgi:flagellar hook-associated protein 2